MVSVCDVLCLVVICLWCVGMGSGVMYMGLLVSVCYVVLSVVLLGGLLSYVLNVWLVLVMS